MEDNYSDLIGKTIKSVENLNYEDQTIEITFTDGTKAIVSSGSRDGSGRLSVDVKSVK